MRRSFTWLLLLSACAATPPHGEMGANNAIHANPIFAGADPDMVAVCGAWWVYPTTAGNPSGGFNADSFYVHRSTDLQRWATAGPILDMAAIGWIKNDHAPSHGLWAPSLTPANGRYYLYYAIGPQNPTPSRLGVAVAASPAGPFVDSGRPLLTGGNGFEAIDPVVFVDPRSHTPYLYAGGSAGATLRIYELKSNMTEIAREIPVATPTNFTEGAFVHERDGTYYLSYSHGRWNDASYSVHYATGPSPIGPWTYRGAILTSDATHQGPGHHAIAQNPTTGEWFITYHRWERRDTTGPFDGARQVGIERLRYGADGSILPVRMTDAPPPRSVITSGGHDAGCPAPAQARR